MPVSQPEDAAEHAADALADRVAPKSAAPGRAERSTLPVAPSAVWDAVDSPGRPLADHERPQGLGADLSPVRVHTGGRAAKSARMLDAAAYTFGDDIVLGDDVDTRSAGGRRILAHELAHVVQQRSSPSPAIERQGAPGLGPSARPPAEDTLQLPVWYRMGSDQEALPGDPVPGIKRPYTEADRPKLRLESRSVWPSTTSGPPPSLPASFPR